MKKYDWKTLIGTWLLTSVLSVAASSTVLFDARSSRNYNVYGDMGLKREADAGKERLRIHFGKSGGFQIFSIPKLPADTTFDRLTLYMKGDGGAGSFALLVSDRTAPGNPTWCWNGRRWEGRAAITTSNDSWHKRTFLLKDFVFEGKPEEAVLLTPDHLNNLQLVVVNLKSPEQRNSLQLEKILISDHELPAPETSPVEEMPEHPGGAAAQTPHVSSAETGFSGQLFQSADAPPAGFIDWDIRKHFRRTTAARKTIFLNNYWQFLPIAGSDFDTVMREHQGKVAPIPEQTQDWSDCLYLKVPGRWDGRFFDMLDREGRRTEIWRGTHIREFMQARCRRTFRTEADWQGKRVLLHFSGVVGEGQVYLNGRRLGALSGPGSFDVTSYLSWKNENELIVALRAPRKIPCTPDKGNYGIFSRPGMGARWWYGFNDAPGLSDDVFLAILPDQAQLHDPVIATDVGKREISMAVRIHFSGKTVPATLEAKVERDGQAVLELPPVKINLRDGMENETTLSAQWETPACWSPENPVLHTAVMTLRDSSGKVLDEIRERFGFREFKVENGRFLLNGNETTLAFVSCQARYSELPEESLRKLLQLYRTLNFNGLIVESLDSRLIGLCDEIGLMVMMRHVFPGLVRSGEYLPGVENSGYPFQIYLSGKYAAARREFEGKIARIVQKFRNSPSIVIWGINPLLAFDADWIVPPKIGSEYASNDLQLASLKEEAFLRRLDPAREVFHSMSSNTGKVITTNPYPTFFTQPDEWADWPMVWAARRNRKPLMLEEVALPYIGNWSNWYVASQNRFREWGLSRQLFFEQSARYLGDSCYTLLHPEMGNAWSRVADTVRTDKNGYRHTVFNRAAEEVSIRWIDRVAGLWRFYGVNGYGSFETPDIYYSHAGKDTRFTYLDLTAPGRKPDSGLSLDTTRISRIGKAYQKLFMPFLARLGGREGRVSSLEHNYSGGETVSKQMLFSNHFTHPVEVAASWRVKKVSTGEQLASGNWNGVLQPGENRFIPFDWTTPKVARREGCRIDFTASAGGVECSDSFDLTVFPPVAPLAGIKQLRLYQETPYTGELLTRLGVPFRPYRDGEPLGAGDLLVVGRESNTADFARLARRNDLAAAVKQGLTLLFFEQNGASQYAPYLEERRVRHVFIKDRRHPVLQNLEAEDLLHWRGPSAMTEEFPQGQPDKPLRFMHWGSEGTVASFVQDKPFSGNFRVILDADADLSRSVLQELFHGRGRVILSSLDLCGRPVPDPAALQLARNLIAYAAIPPKTERRAAGLIAPEKTRREFAALGFPFPPVREHTGPANLQLLIVDCNDKLPDAAMLGDFAAQGGDVLLLAPSSELLTALPLPQDMKFVEKNLHGVPAPRSELMRGLGNSDFYFNLPQSMRLLTQEDGSNGIFAEFPHGKGRFLLLQLKPDFMAGTHIARKVGRIFSTLFTNLGVASTQPLPLVPEELAEFDLTKQKVPFQIDPDGVGVQENWHRPEFKPENWRSIRPGLRWEAQGITMPNPKQKSAMPMPYDGDGWYRITLKIPDSYRAKDLRLTMTRVDDTDQVWFNGALLGETGTDTPNYWEAKRSYRIPSELIHYGANNLIAVRVGDLGGEGGIIGEAKVTWDGAGALRPLYPRGDRLIFDFDPNGFRQW